MGTATEAEDTDKSRHTSVSSGENSGNAAPPAQHKRLLQSSEGSMAASVVRQVRYLGRETDRHLRAALKTE